jgi:hypothetical protein
MLSVWAALLCLTPRPRERDILNGQPPDRLVDSVIRFTDLVDRREREGPLKWPIKATRQRICL